MANEMRDRLVNLIYDSGRDYENMVDEQHENGFPAYEDYDEWLADDILGDGWIRLPCKIGDVCYPLPRYRTPIVERKVSRITLSKAHIIIGYYENDGQYRPPLRTRTLGEDVFLTKSEAEQKLKEMRGE